MSLIIGHDNDAPRPDEPQASKTVIKNRYEHQEILSQFLSTIATCPMDDELKTILRMRIWGKDPGVFCPMSFEDIAMLLKTKVENVKRWEEDALWNIEQYLKRVGIISASEKFIRDGDIKKIVEERKRVPGLLKRIS